MHYALDDANDVLIAYKQNGRWLTPDHGFTTLDPIVACLLLLLMLLCLLLSFCSCRHLAGDALRAG